MSSESNTINLQEYKKVINVPYAIVIASFIIIIITTNVSNSNGVASLLGGYYGLMLGMFFIMVLSMIFIKSSLVDMFPIFMIIGIISVLIVYLTKYFDRISNGEVSGYYSSFSVLSIIFLATQIIYVISAVYNKSQDHNLKMFSDTTFSLLGLFSVINILIVITIGVVLHFYSTQG